MLILDVADLQPSHQYARDRNNDWWSVKIDGDWKKPVGNILIIENKPGGNEYKIKEIKIDVLQSSYNYQSSY